MNLSTIAILVLSLAVVVSSLKVYYSWWVPTVTRRSVSFAVPAEVLVCPKDPSNQLYAFFGDLAAFFHTTDDGSVIGLPQGSSIWEFFLSGLLPDGILFTYDFKTREVVFTSDNPTGHVAYWYNVEPVITDPGDPIGTSTPPPDVSF